VSGETVKAALPVNNVETEVEAAIAPLRIKLSVFFSILIVSSLKYYIREFLNCAKIYEFFWILFNTNSIIKGNKYRWSFFAEFNCGNNDISALMMNYISIIPFIAEYVNN
jgi:hypothetical protein